MGDDEQPRKHRRGIKAANPQTGKPRPQRDHSQRVEARMAAHDNRRRREADHIQQAEFTEAGDVKTSQQIADEQAIKNKENKDRWS